MIEHERWVKALSEKKYDLACEEISALCASMGGRVSGKLSQRLMVLYSRSASAKELTESGMNILFDTLHPLDAGAALGDSRAYGWAASPFRGNRNKIFGATEINYLGKWAVLAKAMLLALSPVKRVQGLSRFRALGVSPVHAWLEFGGVALENWMSGKPLQMPSRRWHVAEIPDAKRYELLGRVIVPQYASPAWAASLCGIPRNALHWLPERGDRNSYEMRIALNKVRKSFWTELQEPRRKELFERLMDGGPLSYAKSVKFFLA